MRVLVPWDRTHIPCFRRRILNYWTPREVLKPAYSLGAYIKPALRGWWFSRKVMSDSCDSMDCNPPGSSVHGNLQAKIPEWVAISFSRGSSRPRNPTQVSCIAGRFFTDCAMPETPHTQRCASDRGACQATSARPSFWVLYPLVSAFFSPNTARAVSKDPIFLSSRA